MAEIVKVERTGPAIRAALFEFGPDDLPDFEAEFRCALGDADDTFDLAPVQAVVDRWWCRAYLRMYPPTPEEQAVAARARAGDFTGLYTRTDAGEWVRMQ